MTTINHADFMVEPGRTVNLANFDPASTADFKTKQHARAKLRGDSAGFATVRS
jgi:hypothetical protein